MASDPPWKAAEEAAALWLRQNGWPDAHVTSGGADGGVDVRATGLIAQVKHYSKLTGSPALQQLYGVAAAEQVVPVFFASGGYSKPAQEFATNTALACVTFCFRTLAVTDWNWAAYELVSSRVEASLPIAVCHERASAPVVDDPTPTKGILERAILRFANHQDEQKRLNGLARIEQDLAKTRAEVRSLKRKGRLGRFEARRLVLLEEKQRALLAERKQAA